MGEDTDNFATTVESRRLITEAEALELYPDPADRKVYATRTYFYQPESFAFKQGFPIKDIRLFNIIKGSVEIGLFDKEGTFMPFLTLSQEQGDKLVMIPIESTKSEFTVKIGKEPTYLALTEEAMVKNTLKNETFTEGLANVQVKILMEICRKFTVNWDACGSSVMAIGTLILRELKNRPNLTRTVLEMLGRHVVDLENFWDEPFKLRAQPYQELIEGIEEAHDDLMMERKLLIVLLANPTPRELLDTIVRISKITREVEDEQLRLLTPMFVKLAKTATADVPVSYYMVAKRIQEGIVTLGSKLVERLKS